ncbi:hypothetical protein FRC04_006521 [Tulasnella sp. 424]|nr:hypothetical protein FRC04_006521 [Tulasnella sp. 424]KAG8981020.1 hypothetical protein FRC05_003920 [Tulasnella sp. 425]
MNARYESEHVYITQQTLMMGLAAGGGIGDIPSMSQSYRRAVLKNPPKGEYLLVVQPPQKQGSAWHYGGRIIQNPNAVPQSPGSSDSAKSFKEYQIWRKWEDCLDLQKTVEREFSYWSSRRRKIQLQNMNAQMNAAPAAPKANSSSSHGSANSHGAGRPSSPVGLNSGANAFYTQPSKAASFDSLPSGPEPLSMALDVHTLIPKLSKKAALFGRPSPQLLQQRAEDFRSFIDALFQIQTPVMEDVRQAREIRDWFGYWKRDKEAARKTMGPSSTLTAMAAPSIHAPPSPSLSNSSPSVDKPTVDLPAQTPPAEKTMSLSIPKVDNRASLGTSASSESGSSSSLIGGHGDASAESEDEDELLDTFPSTPSVSSSSNNPSGFTPIIRTGQNDSLSNLGPRSGTNGQVPHSPTTPTAIIPPYNRPKIQEPNAYMGFSVGGMMAPVPMFRSKSGPSAGLQRPSSAGVGMQRPSSSRSPPPLSTSPSNNLTTLTANTPVATPAILPPPRAGPVPRPPRLQRPSTANAATGGNRQGRIFIVEPEPVRRPRSANSDRKRSVSAGQLGGDGASETASVETSHLPFDGSPLRLKVDDEVLSAGQRERSMSAVETSHSSGSSAPPRPRANTVAPTAASMVNRSSSTSPVVDHPPDVEPLSTLLHKFHHLRKHSAASQLTAGSAGVGSDIFPDSASFIDIALPAWSVPQSSNSGSYGAAVEEAEPALGKRSRSDLKAGNATMKTAPTAPVPSVPSTSNDIKKKRLSAGRGGRHSISSIESYLSDSSIDAALSTLRIGGSTTSAAGSTSNAPLPSPGVGDPILPHTPSGLRRSLSIGAASHKRSSVVARVPEEEDIDEETWAKERQRRLAAIHSALLDEDEDVVDNYFYSRPSSTSRPSAPIPPHSPITPTSATSFVQQPLRRSDSISSSSRVPPSPSIQGSIAEKDELFSLKVLFPSFTDCAALALRLPRTTSYMDLQCRLHIKFHEAEGIDLSKLEKGFRLGYKPKDNSSSLSTTISAKRSSAATSGSAGSGGRPGGRSRSMSVGSASMVDPSLLAIIKNEEDWKNAIPLSKEKLILQVIVDQ